MIGRILMGVILGVNILIDIYKAGAFAHGKREVQQGPKAARTALISTMINLALLVIIYLDW